MPIAFPVVDWGRQSQDTAGRPPACAAEPTFVAEQQRAENGSRSAPAPLPDRSPVTFQQVEVPHSSLKHGDQCPDCLRGKVYAQRAPGLLVRITARAPIEATVYQLQKLRCNLCGDTFTAQAPEGVGDDKYDEPSASMIALLKYGSGVPFHRLEKLQESLSIPLPASTQWEIVEETAEVIRPALEELIHQAAQAAVLHNGDTHAKVLALSRAQTEKPKARTGVFPSWVVSVTDERKIALFLQAGSMQEKTWRRC